MRCENCSRACVPHSCLASRGQLCRVVVFGAVDLTAPRWRSVPIDDTTPVIGLRTEGLAELKLGRYRRARRTLEKALTVKPESKRLRHDLGKVHLAAGQPEVALEELGQIPDDVSHSEILWKDRALAHLQLGNPEEALMCAQQALERKPNYVAAHVMKARAQHALGQGEAALVTINSVARPQKPNREVLYRRGKLLHALGRYSDALQDFNAILDRRPRDQAALEAKGLSHDQLDESGAAAVALQQSLEAEDEVIYNDRGVALSRLGYNHRAIESYRRALAANPRYATCWFNIGKALFRVGNLKEALQAFTRATELNPQNRSAWNNRGVTLRQLNRIEETIPCYERAIQLKQDYAWAWHNKGYALELLDRPREALECYQQTLMHQSGHEDHDGSEWKQLLDDTEKAITRIELILEH